MTVNDYNRCVDDYADGVYRFILKNIRNEDKARDIVQESFLKMWEKRSGIDRKKSKSYLFSTAYHTLIDTIRKEKKEVDLEHEEISLPTSTNEPDLKQIINQGLERLSNIQKTVLMLRDYEGYSYREIGEITHLNESQVKVYIFRARMVLKEYIGSLETVL